MMIKTGLVCTLCAAAMATCASAQETTPVDPATIDLGQRMAMSYANMSNEFFEDLLEAEQMLKFCILTKQQVVAAVCEGFALDEDRMSTTLNTIMATQPMQDGQPNALRPTTP